MGYMESHVRKWEVGRGTGGREGGGVGGWGLVGGYDALGIYVNQQVWVTFHCLLH